MKAAVLTQYRHIEWQDVPDPSIQPDEVLLQIGHVGICGSDMHIFNGEFHPRTTLPLIMGHEFAGTIVEVGKAVQGYAVGERVAVDPIAWCGHCPACERGHFPACTSLKLLGIDSNGAFAQRVAAKDFMLYKIDERISDVHAAMIEVLSIGFHACQRAQVKAGDSLAIFGAGRIGQCILQAARTLTDQPIYLVDILDERLKIATDSVADVIAINASHQDPVAVIQNASQGRGVDIALEAVGHAHPLDNQPHPVAQAVEVIRGAGTVCVLGLGDDPIPLLMKKMIWKEARLVTSRVTHGEFQQTIEHLAAGHLHPDALISAILPATGAQEAFGRLEDDPQHHLKILLAL